MQISIRVQSSSDIITNSSSEVFTIYSDKSKSQLLKLLEQMHDQFDYNGSWEDWNRLSPEEKAKYDHLTGMGGWIEIKTFDDYYQEYLSKVPDSKKHLYTKELHSIFFEETVEELEKRIDIIIDEGYTRTIDWIIKNLYVIDADNEVIKNKDGRVVKLVKWEEDASYNPDSVI